MPYVDENRQKGNFAEATVAAWLSRQCLVRPVANGTDIGVDLYRESLVGASPFQHFWAQVKAIPQDHIRKRRGQEEAWYAFETRHLRYWQRQPVPVYAFLVLVIGWPPPFPSRVYGIKITDRLVREGIPDRRTVTYSSHVVLLAFVGFRTGGLLHLNSPSPPQREDHYGRFQGLLAADGQRQYQEPGELPGPCRS